MDFFKLKIVNSPEPGRLQRVLLVNYEYPPIGGGAGIATANIARQMGGRGIEVMVLTSAFRNLPYQERSDAISIKRVPTIRRFIEQCSVWEMIFFMFSAAVGALRLIDRWRPDVVITFFGLPCGPVGWILKKFSNVPYIISLRGGDVPGHQPETLKFYHRVTKPIIHFLWRRADAIVANSQGLREQAVQSFAGVPIGVIPNGVDTDFFMPQPDPPNRNHSRLLWVGRLQVEKAVDRLLTVLAGLPGYLQWTLTIAGDGPEKKRLESLTRTLGLEQRVEFLGWIDRRRIVELYQKADIFVFPSRDEGMPNVVLEAMACGLPVVASCIAGIEELVINGQTGFLAAPDDLDTFAIALIRLLNDRGLRIRMGASGRERVIAHYSWSQVAENYLRLAEALTGMG